MVPEGRIKQNVCHKFIVSNGKHLYAMPVVGGRTAGSSFFVHQGFETAKDSGFGM
jgi:hypothetical protein